MVRILTGILILAALFFGARSAILQAGWHFSLPPIARGLPLAEEERDKAFELRVQRAFPLGTPQQTIVRRLRREDFEIASDGGEAEYQWIGFGCICRLQIIWQTDDALNEAAPIREISARVNSGVN